MLKSRLLKLAHAGESDEFYHPISARSHPGEEFLFVLSGEAEITVGKKRFKLKKGESVDFWSDQPHTYAPGSKAELPVRLLCLQIPGR